MDDKESPYYNFLYQRLKDDAEKVLKKQKEPMIPIPYEVPGPQEPLPGRSHYTNYFPLYPLQNAYIGGVELDPSITRHIGGDMNIPIPSWGIMDINGDYMFRIRETVYKYGYNAHPVNMLGLQKEDLIRLMNSPSFHHNREVHPTLPLVKLPRSYVPMSCKPPLCNPFTYNYGIGFEADLGGMDGVQGSIDIPIPVSKDTSYRYPLSGNIYYALDNITLTWAHELSPIDPYKILFDVPTIEESTKYNSFYNYNNEIKKRNKRYVEDINYYNEIKNFNKINLHKLLVKSQKKKFNKEFIRYQNIRKLYKNNLFNNKKIL
uniref:Uncharacterized protein n=1 Tax=Strongyloides stercoralis TaxID=6248 RepID=A0A0K0ER92_STRER